MDLTNLKRIKEQQAQLERDSKKQAEQLNANVDLQKTIVKSFSMLVDYLDGKTSKTVVVNQLKEIATPDALKVVSAVEDLHKTLKTYENVDLTEMTSVLKSILDEAKQIPKSHPEEKEDKDYTDQFTNMVEAVKSLEKIVQEKDLSVTVQEREQKAPVVNVDAPNLEPLRKEMANVVKSVKSLVFPEYKTDNTEVEKLLKKSNKLLADILDKPVGGASGGGRATPYESNGIPQFVELTNGGVPIVDQVFASRLDDSASPIIYIGKAPVGSSESSAVWQIAKLDTSSGLIKTWAGTGFDQIWDDRTSLTYS